MQSSDARYKEHVADPMRCFFFYRDILFMIDDGVLACHLLNLMCIGLGKLAPTVGCPQRFQTPRLQGLTLIFRGIIIRAWGNPSICCCISLAGYRKGEV